MGTKWKWRGKESRDETIQHVTLISHCSGIHYGPVEIKVHPLVYVCLLSWAPGLFVLILY